MRCGGPDRCSSCQQEKLEQDQVNETAGCTLGLDDELLLAAECSIAAVEPVATVGQMMSRQMPKRGIAEDDERPASYFDKKGDD